MIQDADLENLTKLSAKQALETQLLSEDHDDNHWDIMTITPTTADPQC